MPYVRFKSHVLWHSLRHVFFTVVHYPPPPWLDSPSGPRPPHCWGFKIALRHTTFGKTPLDEHIRPRGHWDRQLDSPYAKHVRNYVYNGRSFRKAVIHVSCFSSIRILFYGVYLDAVRRTTAYSFTMTGNVIPAQELLIGALAKTKCHQRRNVAYIIFSAFMFARQVSW